LFETSYEEIKYMKQLQELDDLVPRYYYSSGLAYSRLFQFEKAIPEYEKSLELYEESGIKPAWVFNYTQLGEAYNPRIDKSNIISIFTGFKKKKCL